MSRYILPSAKDTNHEVVVGWDSPMRTYFAQVRDLHLEAQAEETLNDDINPIVFWIGTKYDEIQNLDDLKTTIASYAEIPQDILQQLQTDLAAAPLHRPSPIQALMESLQSDIL